MGWSGGSRGQELGGTDKSFNRKVNPDRLGLTLDEGVRVNQAEGEKWGHSRGGNNLCSGTSMRRNRSGVAGLLLEGSSRRNMVGDRAGEHSGPGYEGPQLTRLMS